MKDLWPIWYRPPGYHRRSANDLVLSVGKDFGALPEELRGASVRRHLSDARCVIAVVLRSRGWSYPQIGQLLNRDHSTVMYMCATRFPRAYQSSPAVADCFHRHRNDDAQFERVRAA